MTKNEDVSWMPKRVFKSLKEVSTADLVAELSKRATAWHGDRKYSIPKLIPGQLLRVLDASDTMIVFQCSNCEKDPCLIICDNADTSEYCPFTGSIEHPDWNMMRVIP